MKTLILMRHAKSAWNEADQKDIDRPLAPRGRKAAPRMGAWLADEGYLPDFVLCSTARRARETLDLVLPSLPREIPVRHEVGVYMATPRELLALIGKAPDSAGMLMVVGHNPGLGALAAAMAGDGDKKALANLHAKFPTGAIAVLSFNTGSWSDIVMGKASLRAFLRPRDQE